MRKYAVVAVLTAGLAGCPSDQPAAPDAQPPAEDAAAPPPPMPRPRERPPEREALSKAISEAATTLEGWVRAGAADPKNAWSLAHGLLAFGKDMKAAGGRRAIDVIVQDFVEKQQVRGREVYVFPEIAADGRTPVAPHRNMIVKKMLEAGVPLSQRFKLKGGETITLDRLVKDAEWTFRLPESDADYRNFAWSASAFLQARAAEGTIATATGALPLAVLRERALAQLERENAFLEELMRAGAPERVEKRKQGIYSHTCGGLHLVQAGLLGAVKAGDERARARARVQIAVVLFRWEAERMIYAEAKKGAPQYLLPLLVQELKFYGHVLETLALAAEWGLVETRGEMARKVRLIAGDLLETLRQLEYAYTHQVEVEKASRQVYYDLIGDGCHAIRGLRRSLVAFFPGS